jgi:hypothetical protein
MTGDPLCPRCGRLVESTLAAPTGWSCYVHGAVTPLQPFTQPNAELLGLLARRSRIPVWLPWPLPHGWIVTGVGHAGSPAEGVRATVVACGGPNPLGGPGELLIISEEPGVGLGARYAGLPGPDPGTSFGRGPAQAKVHTDGHPTPLWHAVCPDGRAAYAGEAAGRWLWLIFWPDTAGALLVEPLELADARGLGHEVDLLPFGALTPQLTEPFDGLG